MAIVTGNVRPFHNPYNNIALNSYTVANLSGSFNAQLTAAGNWVLPQQNGVGANNIVIGASISIRNATAYTLTLTCTGGDTINGSASYTLGPQSSMVINADGSGDWKVFTQSAVAILTAAPGSQAFGNVTANGSKLTLTFTSTLAANTSATATVTNSSCLAGSGMSATIIGYTGTYGTNGIPMIAVNNVANGSFNLVLTNLGGSALAGTLIISILLF